MKEDHSLIVDKKPSFDLLSAQLSTCTAADFRQITNKWVLNQGTEQDQLGGIITIFEQAGVYIEGLNEVVMEAWGMLTEGRMWRAKFTSKDEAIRALDTPLLKDVRIRAQTSRNRKERFIMTIKKEWKEDVTDWQFDKLGENYLSNVASAARKWSFDQASDMVGKITVDRLGRTQSGRGSSRSVLTKD